MYDKVGTTNQHQGEASNTKQIHTHTDVVLHFKFRVQLGVFKSLKADKCRVI